MKIALIFSAKCSTYLPDAGFDIEGLYETRALTGSESGIFNIAKGLSELGHEVHVYCKTHRAREKCTNLAGASIFPQEYPMSDDYDGYVAWNDSDHLPAASKGIRICSQQLNDFSLSVYPPDRRADIFAFPSENHMEYMIKRCRLKPKKCVVVPNSTNIEFFDPNAEKVPGSVVYTSSPDRGLHHLLDIFPLVRAQVPHANLKIFYRFWPWYKVAKENPDLIGQRARYIAKRLKELGTNGENGITLVGPVDNRTLGRELSRSMVLAYPCAPVRYTEGFSIAILDACAAACMPVISGVDALPSIYSGTAEIIYGRVGERLEWWAKRIAHYLTDRESRVKASTEAAFFAQKFSRQNVSKMWEKLIGEGKL
jgi:glycosyltransferase involved in cell wall biosynthesis